MQMIKLFSPVMIIIKEIIRCQLQIKKLYLYLKKGAKILADDGTLSFIVDKVIKKDIHCFCLNKGKLRSKKGINVPDISFKQELLTKKDKKLLDFPKVLV